MNIAFDCWIAWTKYQSRTHRAVVTHWPCMSGLYLPISASITMWTWITSTVTTKPSNISRNEAVWLGTVWVPNVSETMILICVCVNICIISSVIHCCFCFELYIYCVTWLNSPTETGWRLFPIRSKIWAVFRVPPQRHHIEIRIGSLLWMRFYLENSVLHVGLPFASKEQFWLAVIIEESHLSSCWLRIGQKTVKD